MNFELIFFKNLYDQYFNEDEILKSFHFVVYSSKNHNFF